MAQAPDHSVYESNTEFGHYVNQLKSIETEKKETKRQLAILQRGQYKSDEEFKANKGELKDKLESLYDSTEDNTQLQLPPLTGLVAVSLDETLKKNNITVQTHHGGSFVGNHWNKYLQEETTKDIL